MIGGLAAEFFCIIYLGSIKESIDVIIRYVALANIAKVDDIYFAALPKTMKIKAVTIDTKQVAIKNHRRDMKKVEKTSWIAFKL